MNTLILTSYLDFCYEDELGNKIPQHFGNKNQILDILKKSIKKYDNFLFIASDKNNYEITDLYANICFKSFELTLPFKNYTILDGRNLDLSQKLVSNADFIFLCGGHVPTQNRFFNDINLKSLIKTSNAVICGGSAGSMNMANSVYCPPELPGETIDPKFKRHLKGLGLTNIKILPHFEEEKNLILDEKSYLEDILLPDSYSTTILAIDDGSFILINNNAISLHGSGYKISNGIINRICNDNEIVTLDEGDF